MTLLRIHDYLTDPKPLARVSRMVRPEEFGTDEFQQFAYDLAETMIRHNAMGLAANQVDASSPDGSVWRMFALRGEAPMEYVVVCNPNVIKQGEPTWGNEGCLSFRSVHVQMRVSTKVHATYTDADGQERSGGFTDVHARAFLHELEHLDGKTLLNRLTHAERAKFLKAVGKARRP